MLVCKQKVFCLEKRHFWCHCLKIKNLDIVQEKTVLKFFLSVDREEIWFCGFCGIRLKPLSSLWTI